MRIFKLCTITLLLTAMLHGCVVMPPTTTRPNPADPTTVPGTTAAPTEPTQITTEPPVTTVPPETTTPTTTPVETTAPPTVPPETTVPPTAPTEVTAPPTEAPATTVPPTEPKPTECSHTYRTETVAATCTTAGKETKTCTRCGHQQAKTLPATGHAYDSGSVLVDAATCADMGTIRYSCSRCGHSYDTTYRGNHRFGEPYHGSPHGYEIACQDCGYAITDFYTWFEESFSDCDKTAALYTDTITLKEPVYTGMLSQWSDTWLDWHDHIMDVMKAYGSGGYSSGEYGVGLSISASISEYGSLDAFLVEINRFLDAFESVYNWRPVWDGEPEVYDDVIYVYWETSDLIPAYEKGTNAMSGSKRDALVKDLVAFHIHRMGLRSGMQLYNSVGAICEYMQYRLMTYDYNYRYGSAFRGLTCGVTVCQGYAEVFQLLAEYCGIKSVLVTGTLQGTGHAWNRVTFSDGTERYVDVTNMGADYYMLVPWSHMEQFGFVLK